MTETLARKFQQRKRALLVRRPNWIIGLLGCAWWSLGPAVLAHAAVEDPVELGREALSETRQPWYDAEHDQLRPIGAENTEQARQRADWRPAQRTNWDWNINWNFSWLGTLFELLAWGILFVAIGLLIYALARTYLNLTPVRADRDALLEEEIPISDDQRIQNLPVNVRKPKGDFLAAARQHYEEGNFAEAIIYLFSYQLLQLDKAGYIRLTKGKTNRQYLFELRRLGEMQRLLAQTMSAFEDVFFGRHPLVRERFETCWRENEQFQQLIRKAME